MNEKVLLVVDMEGCCGIYDLKKIGDCRQKMIDEVDFVISVLNKLGYDNISVLDCHNDGMTLSKYCQENNIHFINHLWSFSNSSPYSCAFLIGFHGMAGTGGYFPHTVRPDIESIYLGNECIGEVSLVINWLGYYNIPVLYISGDQTIEYELHDYHGVFCETKRKASRESSLEDKKFQIEQSITLSLNCPRTTCYSDQQITVEIRNSDYYIFIPKEEFVCKENGICFENTVCMVEKIKLLSSYLNVVAQYHCLRINRLADKLKLINPELLHQDKRARELLLNVNMCDYTNDDFVYLFRLADSIKGGSL